VAEPTAAERRAFAKAGIAMPDGSYYIRNEADLDAAILAVGRGNADHDAIRRHIMKRAKALNFTDKIPDNWAADGSLKHDDADRLAIFLEHYGVQGMHWGNNAATRAAGIVGKKMGTKLDHHQRHILHLAHLKVLAQRAHAAHLKSLQKLHAKASPGQKATIETQARQAKAAHAANMASITARQAAIALNSRNIHQDAFSDDALEHFGVKGMHWGVRRSRLSGAPSPDHAHAVAFQAKAKAAGGIHALSNEELKTLTDRLNLEQNYARLTADKSNFDKGHSFVKTVVGVGKTGVDAYTTVSQLGKIGADIQKEVKKRRG
jgi:hypothetical protein